MTLFDTVFASNHLPQAVWLLLALLTSFLLGLALSWVYRYQTLYTKEFVVTLTLLPTLMTLIIYLVNGSLGTSIAVAGTFSLIRFRSATSGSRELLAIFLSMIIGLASGSGYLLLAIVSTILILFTWFFLERWQVTLPAQTRRSMSLTTDSDSIEEVQKSLATAVQSAELISIKTLKAGSQVQLDYEIELNKDSSDIKLTQTLLRDFPSLDISLSTKAKKRKNL